jgi:hypothetical protein
MTSEQDISRPPPARDNVNTAPAIYFLTGRVKFHREDGSCPKNGPAAPSCLIAHTEEDTAAILNSGLPGFLMRPA